MNSPLYEKPELGADPFRPLEGSRPDKISDGVHSVMEAVASAFDDTSLSFVNFRDVIKTAGMRRLTLDKYISEAASQGLLYKNKEYIHFSDAGKAYLNDKGIVDA